MKSIFSAFIAGSLFALGLILSEMVNPKVVLGFLDVFNVWNPALLLVMLSALIVAGIGYKLCWSREKPLFSDSFMVPTNTILDRRLVLGATLFGMGWGLSGLCPGPAIVGLATFKLELVLFFIAMVIGMKGSDLFQQKT